MFLFATIQLAHATVDDISLKAMADWGGEPYTDTAGRQAAYTSLVKQLGAAISNPSVKVQTLGIFGAEIRFENRFSFIDTERNLQNTPSPWALATPDEDPNPILWTPELQIRKGLPLSSEIGIKASTLFNTKQGSVGFWLRSAPLESYENLPDVSIQWGFSSLVGASELGVNVSDLGIAIGKSMPFGPLKDANSSQFSPYLSLGLLSISGTSRLNAAMQEELGLYSINSDSSSDGFTEGLSPFYASIGAEVSSQDFSASINYRYVHNAISSTSFSIGWKH